MSINSISDKSTPMDMAKLLDRNQNGQLDIDTEIKMSPEQIAVLDENKDKQLSTEELSNAIAKDYVTIAYKTNQAADLKLNPEIFRATSNDKTQGYIYGGGVLGLGAGAGIGALVALATGAPPASGAEIGSIVGGVSGTIGSAVYAYFNHHPETTYSKIDPSQEPDPKVVKPYLLGGAVIGAGVGATIGALTLGRLGLLSMKTSAFVGVSIGGTVGAAIGSAIGTNKSIKQKTT